MELLLGLALIFLVITAAYVLQINAPMPEGYIDFVGELDAEGLPTGKSDLADFNQGLPLSDFMETATGLSTLTAAGCAAADSARQMELGGQYLQRTNNYRREYPDHCSSLRSDFVGGFYKPNMGGVGLIVPCDRDC